MFPKELSKKIYVAIEVIWKITRIGRVATARNDKGTHTTIFF